MVSGGGAGGGVGAGSNEGMGRESLDIEDVEDSTPNSGSGVKTEPENGEVEAGGAESKKSDADAKYGDVSKYHPAWEGFGKVPAEKNPGKERSKL